MALTSTTSYLGTIQKFFQRAWMDLPQEDFATPLANSSVLQKAVIPAHNGQYAEFRKFAHMSIETDDSDDTPKTYGENSEPSSPVSMSASLVQVPFEIIADYIELGNVQMATDPIDLMAKAKKEFRLLIRRKMHQLANSHLVQGLSQNLNGSIPPASTYMPTGFKTIYPTGVRSFEDLEAGHVITMKDLKRARMLLRNAGVPGIFGRKYACILDEALAAQLMDDTQFADAVKRHQDMFQKVHVEGVLADHEGMRFILQDDPYRCQFDNQGGALTTRANTGKVHVCHILGADAAGYVDFGGSKSLARRRLSPKWKVQDTSNTGTGPTVGWRLSFQACDIDARRGLNLAACTDYDEDIDDIV